MTQNENTIQKNEFTPHPDDALYCQLTFDRYADHLQFVTALADDSFARIKKHLAKYSSTEPYTVEFTETRETVTTLRQVQQQLTKSFASEIEKYFHNKYNIDFDSLDLKVAEGVVPFESHEPLVNNIIRQVDNDFHAAGRKQIIQRFQKEFRSDKTQPVLKNNVIQLPFFASCQENKYPEPHTNLKRDCVSVSRHLLDAITYFFYSELQQPKDFTDMEESWRNKIYFDVWYILLESHHLSLKFFKNHRVNLMFKDATHARKFFEYFNLAGIATRTTEQNN